MKGLLRDGLWIKKVPSVYTADQVSQWLSRIQYPKAESINPSQFEANLDNLRMLMQHQISRFPFENTPMHYTAEHRMDIGFDYLYQRLVIDGNGSYCLGNNGLFLQMIRGLGYRAYSSAGRINIGPPDAAPSFITFVHMVIFVQPIEGSNTTYFVDAAGGGSCLTQPILLGDGESVMGATPSEKHSLVRTSRQESSLATRPDMPSYDPDLKVEWRLLVTHLKASGESSTRILNAFIEEEYFSEDYQTTNVGVYTREDDIFWLGVVCSKCFFLDEKESEEVERQQTMFEIQGVCTTSTKYLGRLAIEGKTIKRHVGLRTEVVKTMQTELDRLEGLREWFNIDIHPDAVKHMKGRVPAYE
ncbi:hypothetical protein PM082_008003 [Marasmius tenuissimus]|nr:hypothetical protein PM082_008003 [Marasmius tenuissimus]